MNHNIDEVDTSFADRVILLKATQALLNMIDNIFQFIVGCVLLFSNKIGLIESHYVGTFKHLLDCIINVLIQTVRLIAAVIKVHYQFIQFHQA